MSTIQKNQKYEEPRTCYQTLFNTSAEIIQAVSKYDAGIAARLESFADDFEYGKILEILETM